MSFWSWLNTPAGPPGPVAAHSTLAELIVADALQNGYQNKAALAVAAVFRAREMNADTPAALDVKVGESLVPAPNADQDTQEFIVQTILDLQDFGECYWRTTFDGEITVIPNRDIHVRWDENQTRRLYYFKNNVQLRTTGAMPNLRVLSINRGSGDLTGMGWLQSDRIKGLIAEQNWSQSYFENNADPAGILEVPGTLTKQEATLLKSQWVDNHSTDRTPAVVSGGASWNPTSFGASDSEWTETHRTGVLDVAALSGVPAHFLAASPAGSSMTYTNLSDLYEGYWRMTLWPQFIARITRAWTDVLGQQVRFDPEPLFLASMKDRVYSVSELVRTGFDPADSLDEVGLPPIGHTGEVPVTLQPDQRTTA